MDGRLKLVSGLGDAYTVRIDCWMYEYSNVAIDFG
jgi:hypothetical protein